MGGRNQRGFMGRGNFMGNRGWNGPWPAPGFGLYGYDGMGYNNGYNNFQYNNYNNGYNNHYKSKVAVMLIEVTAATAIGEIGIKIAGMVTMVPLVQAMEGSTVIISKITMTIRRLSIMRHLKYNSTTANFSSFSPHLHRPSTNFTTNTTKKSYTAACVVHTNDIILLSEAFCYFTHILTYI